MVLRCTPGCLPWKEEGEHRSKSSEAGFARSLADRILERGEHKICFVDFSYSTQIPNPLKRISP